MERLDTLMLEARHTQVNIISQLRLPSPYRVLRFEEDFTWGNWRKLTVDQTEESEIAQSWHALLETDDFELQTLAEQWIILLPKTGAEFKRAELPKKASKVYTIRKNILLNLQRDLKQVWSSGTWSLDQKRHYRLLRIL